MTTADLFAQLAAEDDQYARPQAAKEALLWPALAELAAHHRGACPAYARLAAALFPPMPANLAEIPYVPAALFKRFDLRSVPAEQVRLTLRSSGTTGQAVSRIAIDDATARRQARALAAAMRAAVGKTRLPMLLIESDATLQDRHSMNARAAGVMGMMTFGRDHLFALDATMQLRDAAVAAWLQQHGGGPFLIFGFTFMVWQYFRAAAQAAGLDCRHGTLIHSGGWKKLQQEAVDPSSFRAALTAACGLQRCYNFYGMVEQIGSAFLEGDDGLLYPPAFADVIIRDPWSGAALPTGQIGLIEVISLVPQSYPGHAILTEDLGVVEAVDAGCGGRMGKGLRVIGRAPRAELRGCGDTHAAALVARDDGGAA